MVFDKVKELISEQLDVKADDITEASNIQDDLGADSLDLFELVMALEDEYSVEIPAEELDQDCRRYRKVHRGQAVIYSTDIPAVSGSALYGGIFVSVPMFCTIAHMDSADT